MGDLVCRKCGEPWDSYGVIHYEDMTKREAVRFLRGEGCPSCEFGKRVPKLSREVREAVEEAFFCSIAENVE